MEGRRSNFPKKENPKKVQSKKSKKQYWSEGDESEDRADDKSQISTPLRHKGGGGNKGRQLVRWDDDLDILLLMTLQAVCTKNGLKLPWDKVARAMGAKFTEGAIVQHLSKLRVKRLSQDKPVPQLQGRGSGGGKVGLNQRKAIDDSEDESRDSIGNESDVDNVNRHAPKGAQSKPKSKKPKKPSAKGDKITGRRKRKVEFQSESDVKCADAPVLRFGHGELTKASSLSHADDREDLDGFEEPPKNKVTFESTSSKYIARFSLKKSSILKLQFEEAMKEEAMKKKAKLMAPPTKRQRVFEDPIDGSYPDVPPAWSGDTMHMAHSRVPSLLDDDNKLDLESQIFRDPRLGHLELMAPPGMYDEDSQRRFPSNPTNSGVLARSQQPVSLRGPYQTLGPVIPGYHGHLQSPRVSRIVTSSGSSLSASNISYGYPPLDRKIPRQQTPQGQSLSPELIDPRILDNPMVPRKSSDDSDSDGLFVKQDPMPEDSEPRFKEEEDGW
ncbi:hypothetical protein N7476_008213 [Penicillium atrosanguineum]|uniref:Myb-like domain-containing protein n=1 Tax=Penicillium atrosanguineum TaxID=1132637 RepID=A0A9W9PR86_9EURO|nr:hypothetical protein N7526_003954 [Penicillium atrosanguineum]KAJ5307557.1 hypothetical protein N7476_008213 [Penicillium atrosanguineum]